MTVLPLRISRRWLPAALSGFFVAAAAVIAAPTADAADARAVRVPAGATPIPGSYIVVLEDGSTVPPAISRRRGQELAEEYGVTLDRAFTRSVRGFAGRMSAQRARQLAADPLVAYVEQDSVMSVAATQSPVTWGLDRIDQQARPIDNRYTYTTTASNVSAYVIDSGIRTTHTEFGGRAVVGFDAVGDGRNGQDCNGHGTHVAGTVGGTQYGVAKEVRLVAVRVLGCDGRGPTSGVIAGVDWVTANAARPAVANMSLGGGASSALDAAVRRSIAAGITYALSAGNENVNACTTSPARTAEAITVGATTSTDARASYSNYGSCLDIFAPGSSITSSYSTSDTTAGVLSGTSMASPHVAGVAALYVSRNPGAAPQTVRDALVNAAPAVVTGGGTGSPNGLLNTAAVPTSSPGRSASTDYDGDGRSELSVWRPSSGTWYAKDLLTGAGRDLVAMGSQGDVAVDGDFTGDGRADPAVWRPSDGVWTIRDLAGAQPVTTSQWGSWGDVPAAADYNGDGRSDLAVWRPSTGTWWVKDARTEQWLAEAQWGQHGDVAVPGDVSGDGRADYVIWRPSTATWYVRTSGTGQVNTIRLGEDGDLPVVDDFSGDGSDDLALWRRSSGMWTVRDSVTGAVRALQWGQWGDIPVPGDYNGDGRGDLAIWRPSTGVWWVLDYTTAQWVGASEWGVAGDVPQGMPSGARPFAGG